jgi:hypothetical protein
MKLRQILEAKYAHGEKVHSYTFYTSAEDAWKVYDEEGVPQVGHLLGDEYGVQVVSDPRSLYKDVFDHEFKHLSAHHSEKRKFKKAFDELLNRAQGKQGIWVSWGYEYDWQLTFIEGSPGSIGDALWGEWIRVREDQDYYGDEISEKEWQEFDNNVYQHITDLVS